jgi:hypothetical protein
MKGFAPVLAGASARLGLALLLGPQDAERSWGHLHLLSLSAGHAPMHEFLS